MFPGSYVEIETVPFTVTEAKQLWQETCCPHVITGVVIGL